MPTPDAFDLTAPLPRGTTVLEASAGTGKTFAIAALAARYVAEGWCTLPQLLVVTFTRAATAELRDRVRRRLVDSRRHLEATLTASRPPTDDVVLEYLATGPRQVLQERLDRLIAALDSFDAATISTIHGFCQHVLRGIGLVADVDTSPTMVEDQTEILEAVVDDLLVRRYATAGTAPTAVPQRSTLVNIARAVCGNPDAHIVPDGPGGDSDADQQAQALAELAHQIRAEVDRRKRHAGVLSYDDLLTRLRDAVADAQQGRAAADLLRDRYRIALIDEFQDTDPIQWDILRRAFHDTAFHDIGNGATADPQDRRALVLIGDPKQAIYAFRGADVQAYLQATRAAAQAGGRRTLPRNWRSDDPLVQALNRFFDGATFGSDDIRYLQVEAAPSHADAGVSGVEPAAPLQIRCVPDVHGVSRFQGKLNVKPVRDHIAADVAERTIQLLSGQVQITRGAAPRRLEPGDIAVLVRTNSEASQVQRALRNAAVPAVVNGVGSVFLTAAASDWRYLLEALERPASPVRARRAALTPFFGWTGQRLESAPEQDWEALHDRLHAWSATLHQHGIASLFRTARVQAGLDVRLLACVGGDRTLTDLQHIAQLLHDAGQRGELGPTSLLTWLRDRMGEADDQVTPTDEQARRLESDAHAVQILTVHRSKGLEFPVVLAPYMWSPGQRPQAPLVVHPPDRGHRVVDVGPKGRTGFDDHLAHASDEHAGEGGRLLYVALTRARHHLEVWWVSCHDAEASALAGRLFGGDPPEDRDLMAHLQPLAAANDGRIAVVEVPARIHPRRWQPPVQDGVTLERASFARSLDRSWRRASYSSLTADRHADRRVSSEAEDVQKDDEELSGLAAAAPDPLGQGATRDEGGSAALMAHPLPLAQAPGGADFGTFVHAVLEEVDFTADDLHGTLRGVLTDQAHRHGLTVDLDLLCDGLHRVIHTPLGPLAGERSLREVSRRDRRDEVVFELPLAGGDDPRGEPVTVAAIGRLLDAWLPADDPLAGYGSRLRRPDFHLDVRGYLTGSIDMVLRVADGTDRYLVVDHKTNWLGQADTPTAWHYRPKALAAAMQKGHYPLQALLYQVALHRTLRWRLPDYDPDVHLGGVLYLFVRGMTGPEVPRVDGQPCGVFSWRPSSGLVVAMSDLLDGAGVTRPTARMSA